MSWKQASSRLKIMNYIHLLYNVCVPEFILYVVQGVRSRLHAECRVRGRGPTEIRGYGVTDIDPLITQNVEK